MRPIDVTSLNPRFQHLRKGRVKACEVCGKVKYYPAAYLRLRNPRTCSTSHAAVLKHREGWVPRKKKGLYSKKATSSYRVDALRLYGAICSMCGFNEDVRLLDVDHKDDNHQNDAIENLQVLCVMCHAKITRGVISRGST